MSGSPTLLIANPSADVYGSDLQMLETVSAMTSRGWRVVVTTPTDGQLVDLLVSRGAEVKFVKYPVLRRANASAAGVVSLAAESTRAIPSLRRVLREVAPAAVYVNTVTIPWWIVSARALRIPVVCHVHEAEAQDGRIVRTALNLPLLAANSLIAISQSTVRATTADLPRLSSRTHLIYNGVPKPDQDVAAANMSTPFRTAVIGRLSPRKGTDVALEAVANLRRSGRNVELDVCGTPFSGYEWFEQKLRRRAEDQDLAGAVRFSGYVSPVWPALSRADVILAPSLREPFGNAVVEAQLAGRPVVAAAAMGHLETVTHEQTGLLVAPGDPQAMATAVARLMDDHDLCASLARSAHINASERFTVERYQRDVFHLIASLAGHPHTSQRVEELSA